MALDKTKLRKLAECLYVYDAQADTAATVTASGYFNAVTHNLKKNDLIFVIGAAGTTIDTAFVSSTSGAATVTTVAVEGVTAT